MDKDYTDFVSRMGSFDDSLLDIFGSETELKMTEQLDSLLHSGKLGMHWGVRQSGVTVWNAGEKQRHGEYKMTKEQLGGVKTGLDAANKITQDTKNINTSVYGMRSTHGPKDIKTMTDKELKDQVSRLNLEQQYSNLSLPQTSKGQAYVSNTLSVAGSVLGIASSAVGIALAIRQLKVV